jgi:hypothetical protein
LPSTISPITVDDETDDVRAAHHRQVLALANRNEERERRARAMTLPRRQLIEARAFLRCAVEVAIDRRLALPRDGLGKRARKR